MGKLILISESTLVGPEAEAGVGDVEDLFAVYGVPSVCEGGRIVLCRHGGEIAVFEVGVFNLLAGEVAGAVTDSESAFARTVDEVGSSA